MDPEAREILTLVFSALPWVTAIVAVSVGGWVFTTWLRIKHGYPLENSWGKARLETMERIVTDQPSRLAQEIDRLAIDRGGNA